MVSFLEGGEPEMSRYLILANQTLGGAALERTIEHRIKATGDPFYVVVPSVQPEHEVRYVMPRDPSLLGPPPDEGRREQAYELARQRSQGRLDVMLSRIRALGGEAEGTVGPTDPFEAATQAMEGETFVEVIISTLPIGISRWVKMDLPSRVERNADCPVTVVEAEELDDGTA